MRMEKIKVKGVVASPSIHGPRGDDSSRRWRFGGPFLLTPLCTAQIDDFFSPSVFCFPCIGFVRGEGRGGNQSNSPAFYRSSRPIHPMRAPNATTTATVGMAEPTLSLVCTGGRVSTRREADPPRDRPGWYRPWCLSAALQPSRGPRASCSAPRARSSAVRLPASHPTLRSSIGSRTAGRWGHPCRSLPRARSSCAGREESRRASTGPPGSRSSTIGAGSP